MLCWKCMNGPSCTLNGPSLNANYAPAWVLMGHEFLEVKNAESAVGAYRRALAISHRDYRGWYGLGQAYELLGNKRWALVYYTKASSMRPYDYRFWMAQAACYEDAANWTMVTRCCRKAESFGEPDGHALRQLAAASQRACEAQAAADAFVCLIHKFNQALAGPALADDDMDTDASADQRDGDGGADVGDLPDWKRQALQEACQFLAETSVPCPPMQCDALIQTLLELGPQEKAMARQLAQL
eukprot:Platyproteum_vivax@DN1912_c0_g1_i2.p1